TSGYSLLAATREGLDFTLLAFWPTRLADFLARNAEVGAFSPLGARGLSFPRSKPVCADTPPRGLGLPDPDRAGTGRHTGWRRGAEHGTLGAASFVLADKGDEPPPEAGVKLREGVPCFPLTLRDEKSADSLQLSCSC